MGELSKKPGTNEIFKRGTSMRFLLVIIFALNATITSAQQYVVSRVIGQVYNGSVPVKSGDEVNGLSNLRSTDNKSFIRLNNPDKGSYTICFQKGKRILASLNGKTSEFYVVFIKSYIDQYQSFLSLSTRGGSVADWFDCINSAALDTDKHRVILIANENFAIRTTNFNPPQKIRLYVTRYNTVGDSTTKELNVSRDSAVFRMEYFPDSNQFSWRMKVADTVFNAPMVPITDQLLTGAIYTQDQFKDIISEYQSTLTSNGANLRKDLFDFVSFNYGRHFSNFIDNYINNQK